MRYAVQSESVLGAQPGSPRIHWVVRWDYVLRRWIKVPDSERSRRSAALRLAERLTEEVPPCQPN